MQGQNGLWSFLQQAGLCASFRPQPAKSAAAAALPFRTCADKSAFACLHLCSFVRARGSCDWACAEKSCRHLPGHVFHDLHLCRRHSSARIQGLSRCSPRCAAERLTGARARARGAQMVSGRACPPFWRCVFNAFPRRVVLLVAGGCVWRRRRIVTFRVTLMTRGAPERAPFFLRLRRNSTWEPRTVR